MRIKVRYLITFCATLFNFVKEFTNFVFRQQTDIRPFFFVFIDNY